MKRNELRKNSLQDRWNYSTRTKLIVLVFLAFLFFLSLSTGYGLLNQVFGISTDIAVRPDKEIRITAVEGPILSGGAYENGNFAYSSNLLNVKGVLPNSDSTITYKLTIKNNSSNDKTIEEIRQELNGNISTDIDFVITEDEIPSKESKVVTIVIKNTTSSSVTFSANFTFVFSDVYVDITPPTITFDPMPDSEWSSSNKTILIKAEDDMTITSFQYCVTTNDSCTPDTDAEISGTSITISTDGKNVVCATAIDNAKTPNTTTICSNSEGNYYQIDKTAPTIKSLTSPSTYGKTITISATVQDELSGLVGYTFTNTSTAPTSFTSISKTISSANLTYTVDTNGTYYLWVKDSVGNITRKSIEITYVIDPHAKITGYGNTDYTTCDTVQCALDELYDIYQ